MHLKNGINLLPDIYFYNGLFSCKYGIFTKVICYNRYCILLNYIQFSKYVLFVQIQLCLKQSMIV